MSSTQTNTPSLKYKADILVVDDTLPNLQLLVRVLSEEGYKVRPASNGHLALTAAKSIAPDLILLDIMMPKMNGFEVCQALKADKKTSDIPVIFLSALDDTLDKIEAFSSGGVDYITKPFEVEEILARVKTHLMLRTLQKDLQDKNNRLQQEIVERARAEEAIQQRNRELLLLNNIGQMFNATLDLSELLEMVLTEVHQILDITSTSFWLIDTKTNELVCHHAKGPGNNIISWRLAPGQGITGSVAQQAQSQIVSDTRTDERFVKQVLDKIKLEFRSMISVPLQLKNKIIGVLNVVDKRPNRFSQSDLTLLEPIATTAAIAIENARLFDQEQKAKQMAQTANDALTALNTVAFAVNNSLDLQGDIEKALDVILHIIHLDTAWIFVPEENGLYLRLIANVGLPKAFKQQQTHTFIDMCPCNEVLKTAKTHCYFNDECTRLIPYLKQKPNLSAKHIALPIFAKRKVVGILNLGGKKIDKLSDGDYKWLETVCQQIGNAIENSTLYQKTLAKADRLTVLNRVSTIISHSWQLDQVLPPLLKEVAAVLEMNLGLIVLRVSENKEVYKVRTTFGYWRSGIDLDTINWHELDILDVIEQTQSPLLILNASEDERLKPLEPFISAENIETVLVLPLIMQTQLTGFIQLYTINQERIFERAEVELVQTLTNHAAVAIEKARLYEATVTRYEEELDIARQIQQNLLPRTIPEISGLRIAGLCQPAYATSGDFYDYILLPNNCLGIVVGDVTGKSLPAAMVMALARNTVRSELVNNPSPGESITTANQWLCQDIRPGTFVATLEALLDPINKNMLLVNAGQTATLLLRNGKSSYLLPDEAIGLPLGILADTTYTHAQIPLQSGDILLFYTDGIVEAQNEAGTMFGFEQLEAFVEQIDITHHPNQIADNLLSTVTSFVGQAEQHDDITLVVVQVV